MKAPYKIFLATIEEVQNLDTSFVGIAHSDPQDIVEPIEYIHKNAFIEKVCGWLKQHSEVYDYTWYDEAEHTSGITDKFIEDFINYIKE